jgi:serine/threonine protein phosphatase PrpC
MRVECYGASRPQQGRAPNEDAFLIIRDGIPVAAVCDGAGNAEQAARRVLKLFQLFIREATLGTILVPKAWISWVRQLDSALLGGAESTFLGVAVVGDQVVGAAAGDSQAYLLGAEGGVQFLTASADKARLGSGNVKPFPIRGTLKPRDMLLLMTDGA